MSKEVSVCFHVEAEFHRAIKVQIAKDGVKLRDYITKLIETDLEKKKETEGNNAK